MKTFITLIFFCSQAFAGLPPTTAIGQSETTKTTTFNFQAPFNQFTTSSSVTRLLETNNFNILANPGFEAAVYSTGWSVSGGSMVQGSGNTVSSGKSSLGFTPSAANQFLSNTAIPILPGLYGHNGLAICNFRTFETAYTIQAYDVTTSTVLNSVAISNSPSSGSNGFIRSGVNFIFPNAGSTATSGDSIQIRIVAASAVTTIYVDDCYLGEATNFGPGSLGFSIANQGTLTSSVIYPLTIGAATTAPTKPTTTTADVATWRRVGDFMEITYDLSWSSTTGASNGSGIYYFPMPSGYSIDLTKIPTGTLGQANVGVGRVVDGSNSATLNVIINAGVANTFILTGKYSANAATGNVTDFQVSSASFGTTDGPNYQLSFVAMVPIVGWTSTIPIPVFTQSVISPDQTAAWYQFSLLFGSSATTACTSSPCFVISGSGASAVSSITRQATGNYTLIMNPGTCSSSLICVATGGLGGFIGSTPCYATPAGTGATQQNTIVCYQVASSTQTDQIVSMNCSCKK